MMETPKERAARAMEALQEGWRMTPEERFNKMVALGLIDRKGRVSTQLGGDAETLPITSVNILAW